MPYPEYLGYTKNEIEDLKSVVEEYGDIEIEGGYYIGLFSKI